MGTPHINAKKGDYAETVLLPGDPLRAKFIADTFLKNVKEITNVRNMLGFTGEYKGKRVSVMGSGMGIPSCSIYAKELITEYDVKSLIRVGSAGGIGMPLRSVLLESVLAPDANVNRQRFAGFDYAAIPSFELLNKAYNSAKNLGVDVEVGNCFSADLFYSPKKGMPELFQKMGIQGVEMEAAGLYGVAAEYNAKALAILTISDNILTGEELSAEDRQNTFTSMMEIALETA